MSPSPAPRPPYDPELLAGAPAFPGVIDSPETFAAYRARAQPTAEGLVPLLAELGLAHTEATVPLAGLSSMPDGAMTVSLIRPVDAPLAEALPAVLDLHGGGMVFGNRLDSLLPENLRWAAEHRLVLISPEYPLAPEHRAPAGAEACFAALCWAEANAVELGVDPARLIVAGVSGGAGLAAAVALQARDLGGPALLGQLLVCPMLDHTGGTDSAAQFTAARGVVDPWPQETNAYAWRMLLGDEAGEVHPYASAWVAGDLAGLPSSYVDVGSAEVFRDADIAFAQRLLAAGVDTELHVWPGGFHGFDAAMPGAAVSRRAMAARSAWLGRLLGP